jgi:DNA polymerase-3 subunit alpha
VLPPSVNESARDFTVVAEGIRFGLAGVKNVGEGAIESILEARAGGGAFETLFDFAARIDGRRVNRRVVESLVKCGAFDALHENRSSVWVSLDSALEAGAAVQRDREIGQESLFGTSGAESVVAPALQEAAPWTDRQRLESEKEVLGFYVTGHPLAAVSGLLERFTDVTADETEGRHGREVRAGGLVTSFRETRTRRGALMGFATLEDLEGSFDLVVFAEPFAQYGQLLKTALDPQDGEGPRPLLVSGELESGDPPKILVREVLELERAEERLATQLRVRIRSEEATEDRLTALRRMLEARPGSCAVTLHVEDRLTALRRMLEARPGSCAVTLHVVIPDESETVMAVSSVRGVRPDESLRRDVDALFGRVVTQVAL